MDYTRAATGFQVMNIPCLYQGHRHLLGTPGLQRLLAGVHHSSSSVYSRSSVIPCLYHQKPIHTSGRGAGSTSSAGILQRSDSEAVCRIGAWASAIHAAGRSWQASFPRGLRLRDVQYCGRAFRTAQCSSFRRGNVNLEPRVWASGAGQRENQSWPIASSVTCFSCRISH